MRKIQSFPHPHNSRADIEGTPFSDVSFILSCFCRTRIDASLQPQRKISIFPIAYNLSAK